MGFRLVFKAAGSIGYQRVYEGVPCCAVQEKYERGNGEEENHATRRITQEKGKRGHS